MLNLLTGHFLFVSYTSLFAIIPPYVLDRDGQEWQIGIVVGAFGIMGLILRPFAGRWVYFLGAKRVAIAGAIIFAVASILYIPAFDVWLLIPVRMLQGIGLALGPVATSTIVANLAPSSRRAEAMGYMGNSVGAASLYAPVFSFWLLSQFGFEASFIYSAANGFLSMVFAIALSATRISFPESDGPAESVPLISRMALFPTMVFLGYTVTTAPVNTFLPLIAEDRGLGNPGLYFTVHSFTTMVVMLGSGLAADRLGRSSVIIPGMLSAAFAMFVLMGAQSQLVFLGAAFLSGFGFGLIQPGMQSLTIDRVRPSERGAAMATLQSAWDIGGSGGAFLLGPIAGVVGTAATFGIVGVGTLSSTAGFVVAVVRGPTARSAEQLARTSEGTHDD